MVQRRVLYVCPNPDDGMVASAFAFAGWKVHCVPDVESALSQLDQHQIGVGLLEVDPFPGERFREQLDNLAKVDQFVGWIALLPSGSLNSEEVSQVVTDHCYDYHSLPVDIERLLTTVGHAHGMAMLQRTTFESPSADTDEPEMVAVCPAMREVFQDIRKIAAVDAPILITGETGTGKELAAQAIHERSERSSGPFIAVNCAALPATLIQSELFGHEKGAFTGAHQRKIGRIEAAGGGIIFLDEIGDLSPDLQVNLLRFLQENTIQRVGGGGEISVDVRVIAATHVDLEAAVEEGQFRHDLYFRLNVLRLEMPPLRERGEDIEILGRFFFEKFARESTRSLQGFRNDALDCMRQYRWPGNVRELINKIRRAVVMCENRVIRPVDLGFSELQPEFGLVTLEEARTAAESEAIRNALAVSGNNLSRVAKELGTSRPTLYRLMEKHGLGV